LLYLRILMKRNQLQRAVIFIFLMVFSAVSVNAQKKDKKKKEEPAVAKPIQMNNNTDSLSYAWGILVARNIKNQGVDSLNMDMFMMAMNDVFKNNPDMKMTDQAAQQVAQSYMQQAQKKKAQKNIEAGKKFLEANKAKPGVIVTASGLQYEVLKQGTGPKPKDMNTLVTAHYHGTLIDGTVFDSSVQRNKPLQIKVNQVIRAWQEALMLMNVGTKLRIVCPPEIAYGERGSGSTIGPNAVLIFEMELLSIDN
jgi:FKBP-type peptidyl-prolyl cis-trans isomerase FklB